MGSINFQFSVCSDAGSWLIRQYDHGPWSHVDAVMPDGSLLGSRDDEVGGKPAGVQIRPPNYLPFETIKKISISCADSTTGLFYAFLASQLGKPYDQTAIAGFVFQRDWREQDSWFCSELQAAAAEKSGLFPFKLATPTNKITPSGLYLALSVLTDVSSD